MSAPCPNCSGSVPRDARFCPVCGTEVDSNRPASGAPAPALYAGFWRRVGAALIDVVAVNVLAFVAGAIAALVALAVNPQTFEQGDPTVGGPLRIVAGISIAWLYFALMERSSRQGTLGKMVLGLRVTRTDGGRLSFLRATGRHFAKFLSVATAFVGFVMAAFTRRKQALHDLLAGCLVVRGRDAPP